jgi:hypothetical protein
LGNQATEEKTVRHTIGFTHSEPQQLTEAITKAAAGIAEC